MTGDGAMNIHEGHRERLKSGFSQHGLESFDDLNALELLLFYAIPRNDTNPVAHRLMERFGSLAAVFDASERELMEVDGVGRSTAILIRLLPQILKKSVVSQTEEIKQIRNSADAGRFLSPRFIGEKDEAVYVLFLDSKKCVIRCCEMGRGVVNGADVSVRRIVEAALKDKVSSVIVAHNHPDGIALPSKEDDYFTKRLYSSLNLIGIRLEDHLIFAGDEYVSLADSGLMQLYKF